MYIIYAISLNNWYNMSYINIKIKKLNGGTFCFKSNQLVCIRV